MLIVAWRSAPPKFVDGWKYNTRMRASLDFM